MADESGLSTSVIKMYRVVLVPVVTLHLSPTCGNACRFTPTVCVCVCAFSSHSFWTSSSLDVSAGVTQEEGHTSHLLSTVRALIFLARRIQPFLSLVDREVEFCVLTI